MMRGTFLLLLAVSPAMGELPNGFHLTEDDGQIVFGRDSDCILSRMDDGLLGEGVIYLQSTCNITTSTHPPTSPPLPPTPLRPGQMRQTFVCECDSIPTFDIQHFVEMYNLNLIARQFDCPLHYVCEYNENTDQYNYNHPQLPLGRFYNFDSSACNFTNLVDSGDQCALKAVTWDDPNDPMRFTLHIETFPQTYAVIPGTMISISCADRQQLAQYGCDDSCYNSQCAGYNDPPVTMEYVKQQWKSVAAQRCGKCEEDPGGGLVGGLCNGKAIMDEESSPGLYTGYEGETLATAMSVAFRNPHRYQYHSVGAPWNTDLHSTISFCKVTHTDYIPEELNLGLIPTSMLNAGNNHPSIDSNWATNLTSDSIEWSYFKRVLCGTQDYDVMSDGTRDDVPTIERDVTFTDFIIDDSARSAVLALNLQWDAEVFVVTGNPAISFTDRVTFLNPGYWDMSTGIPLPKDPSEWQSCEEVMNVPNNNEYNKNSWVPPTNGRRALTELKPSEIDLSHLFPAGVPSVFSDRPKLARAPFKARKLQSNLPCTHSKLPFSGDTCFTVAEMPGPEEVLCNGAKLFPILHSSANGTESCAVTPTCVL